MARKRDPDAPPAMPTQDEVRRFIKSAPGRVGKREITQAFRLGPDQRVQLRDMLRDLARGGAVAPAGHKRFTAAGRLPDSMVVVVTGTDRDGEPLARPVEWPPAGSTSDGPPPQVLMLPEPRGRPALAPGERVVARLRAIEGRPGLPVRYEGRTLKRLTDAPGRVLGVYRPGVERGAVGRIIPTDRRAKGEWLVPPGEDAGAQADEIVSAEPLPATGYGLKPARVVERLGALGDARSVSLIVLHSHDIPTEFPSAAIAEAERARPTPLDGRTDLRDVPLVTIDGEDARDFDDAVFAEPDGSGFRLIVAIADVAHYVRPGTPLDNEARKRGNSVYFPDRVVPMLPEALSNGLCSLKPAEERGCLFVEMRIDASGTKASHRFGRGLMRSAARLTYTQVQALRDEALAAVIASEAKQSRSDGHDSSLLDCFVASAPRNDGIPIAALYAAFTALLSARVRRGTLELDLPERKVVLDEAGHVTSIEPRPRLDSHRLIEEFMVLANVCAAEELERLTQPCMYRVHPPPTDEKLEALRSFLHGFDISLPPGGTIHPRDLDRVLSAVAGTDAAPLVNEIVLRSQSQASYSPDNLGHFGLALPRYAHFTSPIRRYADLLVHRALIRGLRLGEGALTDGVDFADAGDHITATERRAALAERDAIDRYLAAFMADKVGAVFAARISGVQRFGLFVTIAGNGASGLVPVSVLPDDFYVHDEAAHTLTGRARGLTFRLAQTVDVRLSEANPITGGLVFHIVPGAAQGPSRPAQRRR